MRPVSPKNYKGIVYIQLDTLPTEQQSQINSWLPATEVIKLKMGECIVDQCLKYDDYLFWYENFFFKGSAYETEI